MLGRGPKRWLAASWDFKIVHLNRPKFKISLPMFAFAGIFTVREVFRNTKVVGFWQKRAARQAMLGFADTDFKQFPQGFFHELEFQRHI